MSNYRKLAFFGLLLIAIGFTACERETISRIKADPGRWQDKEVSVAGEVNQSFSVLNYGFYEIDDGTGKMFIVTQRGAPARGSRVGAKGKINNYFTFAGKNYGLVMMESDRRIR